MTGMADVDEYEEYEAAAAAYRQRRGRRGSHSLPSTPKCTQKDTFNRASFKSERGQRRRAGALGTSGQYDAELERRLASMTVTEILTRRRRLVKQASLRVEVDQAGSPGAGSSLAGYDSPTDSPRGPAVVGGSPRGLSPMTRLAGGGSPGNGGRTSSTSSFTAAQPHHRRAFSCKDRTRGSTRRSRQQQDLEADYLSGLIIRPRTSSMPSRSVLKRPTTLHLKKVLDESFDDDDVFASEADGPAATEQPVPAPEVAVQAEPSIYRVRTFSSSSKGFLNRGDSFKRRSTSSHYSQGAGSDVLTASDVHKVRNSSVTSVDSSVCSGDSAPGEPACYSVLLMGPPGVGKSSLIQQFRTSEYMGNEDVMIGGVSSPAVSVLLDDEESFLTFSELPSSEEVPVSGIQAYVMVYSVVDRDSYDDAVLSLYELRKDEASRRAAVILAANKTDMVRSRQVTEEEAKVMAVRYDAKYIEVSAVLNLKVDELLAGILKQIRLSDLRLLNSAKKKRKGHKCLPGGDSGADLSCMQSAARGLVGKIFKKSPSMLDSCDNLLVL